METAEPTHRPDLAGRSFNGATAFQRWKQILWAWQCQAMETLHQPSGDITFNGATAFQRWKQLSMGLILSSCQYDLQWGHRLSAMETGADRWPWEILQWGHRLSAMETGIAKRKNATAFQRNPSMGPPPFSDGKHREPSMGPPLSAMETFQGSCSTSLQWGHRLSAMETCRVAVGVGRPYALLQWGHRLSAMETFVPRVNGATAFGETCPTFNGATAFQRWKPLFVARLRHGFMKKRSFPQESVTG